MKWPLDPLFVTAAALRNRPVHPLGMQGQCPYCPDGCFSLTELADATGFSRRTATRWRAAGGLDDRMADAAAVALGLHPALIWPGWTEAGVA